MLEYGTPVWSPFLMKDIRKIKSIQRRATKLVPNISNLSYESRLLELGLPTLEYRRDRYDMLQVYKALHNTDDIKWHDMFSLVTNQTRGHSLKLSKKRSNSTQRLHSFSFCIVDQWNNLPQEKVSARTVNYFSKVTSE